MFVRINSHLAHDEVEGFRPLAEVPDARVLPPGQVGPYLAAHGITNEHQMLRRYPVRKGA